MRVAESGGGARRRGQLVGVVFVLAVVLVAVLAGSGVLGGGDPAKNASVTNGVRGVSETSELFAGISQRGITLGRPDAPATIVEFVDVKCPACRQFVLGDGQEVVSKLVRSGRANLELRVIGLSRFRPDTLLGRTAVLGAAGSGRAFQLAELVFYNQGNEGREWVTPAEVRRIARPSPELRGVRISTVASKESAALAAATDRLQRGLEVYETPTIFVRPRGATDLGSYKRVSLRGTGSGESKIADAIDDAMSNR